MSQTLHGHILLVFPPPQKKHSVNYNGSLRWKNFVDVSRAGGLRRLTALNTSTEFFHLWLPRPHLNPARLPLCLPNRTSPEGTGAGGHAQSGPERVLTVETVRDIQSLQSLLQQDGVVLRVLLRGQYQAGRLGAVLFTPVFTGSAPSFSFRYIGECLDILSPLCLTPQQCKMNFNFSLQIRPLGCTDFL